MPRASNPSSRSLVRVLASLSPLPASLKPRFPGVIFKPIDDPNASIQIVLAWLPRLEDATGGRFVAFLRDEARSRRLI
jgi:hypothetical protein